MFYWVVGEGPDADAVSGGELRKLWLTMRFFESDPWDFGGPCHPVARRPPGGRYSPAVFQVIEMQVQITGHVVLLARGDRTLILVSVEK